MSSANLNDVREQISAEKKKATLPLSVFSQKKAKIVLPPGSRRSGFSISHATDRDLNVHFQLELVDKRGAHTKKEKKKKSTKQSSGAVVTALTTMFVLGGLLLVLLMAAFLLFAW